MNPSPKFKKVDGFIISLTGGDYINKTPMTLQVINPYNNQVMEISWEVDEDDTCFVEDVTSVRSFRLQEYLIPDAGDSLTDLDTQIEGLMAVDSEY